MDLKELEELVKLCEDVLKPLTPGTEEYNSVLEDLRKIVDIYLKVSEQDFEYSKMNREDINESLRQDIERDRIKFEREIEEAKIEADKQKNFWDVGKIVCTGGVALLLGWGLKIAEDKGLFRGFDNTLIQNMLPRIKL